MKTLVHFNGRDVLMRASTARALVRRGQATKVEPVEQTMPVVSMPAEVESVTKPVTNATALKGQSKIAWLRMNIREHGGEPSGTTIAALESQLRILKSMVE